VIVTGPALVVPLFVAVGGIACYIGAKVLPNSRRGWTGTFAAVWLLASAGLILFGGTPPLPLLVGVLACGIGGVAALYSQARLDPAGPIQLYFPLYLFAAAGAIGVGFAQDLFTIFVFVELSAIPSYALVAYRSGEDSQALPAAFSYLIQGVAGTMTALLGVSLLYISAGTLSIAALPAVLAGKDSLATALAGLLILVGYGVKLAIVPAHTWLPEAYVRAPVGVTALMAGVTKSGSLVAVFLSLSALPQGSGSAGFLGLAVSLLALLTMTGGNLLALNQKELPRLLAYSSIAQMGYVLLGFGLGLQYSLAAGYAAALLYMVAYAVMKSGAFLAADLFAAETGSPEIAQMRGIGVRHPLLGFAFAVFLLGLVGVPATAGFLGKLLLFQAGMGTLSAWGVGLALALAANSALSLGYYVPVISDLLFGGGPQGRKRPRISLLAAACILVLALGTIILGFYAPYDAFSGAAGILFPKQVI
jgi:proton-translocating NADH-quinone oxidoreductase chain N